MSLLIKVTRDTLPQVKDKYPFIYLEHGRLEIDDSSVKWIDSESNIIAIPVATINAILLGPGTSITHDAVKTITSSNCTICWVGEDSMLFYAFGAKPTADTTNLRHQLELSHNREKSLKVARKMFSLRFKDIIDIESKTLKELMGIEGNRVRNLYLEKAKKYDIEWMGRNYLVGNMELSDITNQLLTSFNSYLYAIISSTIHSLGYSMYSGFVHSGSPLPFVYDVADFYKEELTIDLAFQSTTKFNGRFDRKKALTIFKDKVIDLNILEKIPEDIKSVLGVKNARSNS